MTSNCYCILLRQAARKVTAIYDGELAPTGINLAQYSLLRRIERTAPVSLTELARLTDLDRSTVGRNVKLLQRMTFVDIGAGEDQREATVTLSPEGLAKLQWGAPLWDAAQRKIEAVLGADAAVQLKTLIAAL